MYPLRSPVGCLFLQIARFMEQRIDRVGLETYRVLNPAQKREAQLSTGVSVNEGMLQQIMHRFEPIGATEAKPQLLEALARQRAAARKRNVGPHQTLDDLCCARTVCRIAGAIASVLLQHAAVCGAIDSTDRH